MGAGHIVIFSSVEDAHLAFIQSPLSVSLGPPTASDYAVVLKRRFNIPGIDVDGAATALFSLHSQLSPADLSAHAGRVAAQIASGGNLSDLLSAVRTELMSSSAVSPEKV